MLEELLTTKADRVPVEGLKVNPEAPEASEHCLNLSLHDVRRSKEDLEVEDEDLPVATDFVGAYYKTRPEIVAETEDHREQFLEEVMNSGAYVAARMKTTLIRAFSNIAAMELLQQYKEHQQGGGDPGEDGKEAAKKVNQAVDEAEAACKAFGLDPGKKGPANTKAIEKAFKTLRNSKKMRSIIEHAGDLTRLATGLRQSKRRYDYGEISGLALKDDVSRTCDMALMGHKTLTLEFARRFAEHSLSCYEVSRIEKRGRGPMVFLVDESGSMSGQLGDMRCIDWAKALALSGAWVARSDGRPFKMYGFSSDGDGYSTTDLMKFAEHFYDGGTAFNTHFSAKNLRSLASDMDNPDFVFITDGACSYSKAKEVLEYKKLTGAKVYGMFIDDCADSNPLMPVCDVHHRITSSSIHQAGVRDVLTI